MVQIVTKIIKRDSRVEDFQPDKIATAIRKALEATGQEDSLSAEVLAGKVVQRVQERFGPRPPRVEDVQDIVERILMEEGCAETAKAYILYRQQHADLRSVKQSIGVEDDLSPG